MAEDTSLSFAQATSLQLTGCAIHEHLLCRRVYADRVLCCFGVEPSATTLASLEEFLWRLPSWAYMAQPNSTFVTLELFGSSRH